MMTESSSLLLEQTPVDLAMWTGEDEDEAYLKRLSVYATVRPTDLKTPEDRRADRFRSLQNLFLAEQDQVPTIDEVPTKETSDPADTEEDKSQQELLVKGFSVDGRIAPGFSYMVRYAENGEYLFDGQAKRLESIGMGYGRRLTFKGDSLNMNDCYFWSDSHPDGFVFTIHAISVGDVFTVYDADSMPVGTATVVMIEHPQVELDTTIENTTVSKKVEVRFAVSVKLFQHRNNLINVVCPQDLEVVEGVATVVKVRGSKEALVRCVEGVTLQHIGTCSLHREP